MIRRLRSPIFLAAAAKAAAAGGGGVSPASDPDIWGWWSSDTDLENNGAALTGTWTDRSGNSRVWTRNAAEPPGYTTSGPNGKPAITFLRNGIIGGQPQTMTAPTTMQQPYSMFLLMKPTSWGHNHYIFDRGGAQGALIQNHVSPAVQMYASQFGSYFFEMALNEWQILTVIYDGASSLLQVNNGVALTVNPSTIAGDNFTLNNYGGGGVNGTNWHLAAIIITSAHSDATWRTNHKNWLAEYGGITLGTAPAIAGPAGITTNLQTWLKADAITGKSDGNTVTVWPDSSNQGRWGYSSDVFSAGQQPTYRTNVVNGQPAVRFDVNDGLTLPFETSSAHTTFIVYSHRGAGSAFRRALAGGAANWLVGPYNGFHQFYTAVTDFIQGPAVVQNQFVYATVRQQTGETRFRVNGSTISTSSGVTYPGVLSVASFGLFSEPLDGDVAEIIVYHGALSDGDVSTVEAYLAAKYAI